MACPQKILVLEYITSGAWAGSAWPDGLAREGLRMVNAMLDDLTALPDLAVQVLWDARLPSPATPQLEIRRIEHVDEFDAAWVDGLRDCTALWLVAPESGGCLADLSRAAERAGCRLLGSPSRVVELTARKFATLAWLTQHGVDCVPTWRINDMPLGPRPWLVKPDDGVGCDGVRVLAEHELPQADDIVQTYLTGEALSLSALFWQGQARLLSVNRQHIMTHADGRLSLNACTVAVRADESGVYADLAQRIAQALPELAGYAGIDLIETASGPKVLEINPRLTSSYAGLRAALGINPAEWIVDTFNQSALPTAEFTHYRPVAVTW